MRERDGSDWSKLLIVLLLLWPVVLFFFLPRVEGAAPLLLWALAITAALLGWILLSRARSFDRRQKERPATQPAVPGLIGTALDVEEAAEIGNGAVLFRGRLKSPPELWFDHLRAELGRDTVPLLQTRGGQTSLILLPRPLEERALERRSNPLVNWILLLLTFATTTYAGAAHQGVNLLQTPEQFAVGIPYSLALMAILGCHEMGHYLTARKHGMDVTPPYFIPVPFALGTFGAFIQMRTPPSNRRALFDVAVAGPFAGLIVAIPALYLGLQTSEIMPAGMAEMRGFGALPGVSVLLSAIAAFALPQPLQPGQAIGMGPLAFAGWLGLMVTALNLLPIGQLDGGHIARAMFGTRAGSVISALSMAGLFLLALFVWPGLLMWALIVFFMTGRPTPPLNDVTRITPGRALLGVLAFLILAAIVTPAELLPATMRCPYL